MSIRFTWMRLLLGLALVPLASPANAEAPLPIERKISTFSIRKTKTGYVHVAAGQKSPDGSVPAQIIAIDGRTSTDIWMLTNDAVILQDDGKRIVSRHSRPCGWGQYNTEWNSVGSRLYSVNVDKDGVHAIGEYRGMDTRVGTEQRATLGKDGKWTCKDRSLVPALLVASNGILWSAAYNMDNDACRISAANGFCTSGPRFSPTHVDPSRDAIDMGIYNVAMWMHGLDDGWVVTSDEEFLHALYRFNGVTWKRVAKINENMRVSSIWADEQRHVWITTRNSVDNGARMVLRFDGKNLTSFPVPDSFRSPWVQGTGSRDVWFAGSDDTVYQWDGAHLRQAKLPGEVQNMWISSDGGVFFVLPEAIALYAPTGESR